jgi:hypothetical protein
MMREILRAASLSSDVIYSIATHSRFDSIQDFVKMQKTTYEASGLANAMRQPIKTGGYEYRSHHF